MTPPGSPQDDSQRVCTACGAAYSAEIEGQACDSAHRDSWPHEWGIPTSGAASPATKKAQNTQDETTAKAPSLTAQDGQKDTGDVAPASTANADGDTASRAREAMRRVVGRLSREKRWIGQIALERDSMMKLAKDRFPDKSERQLWVYGELDRMYPPTTVQTTERKISYLDREDCQKEGGSIQGLSTIPEAWPELPANASLAADIAWVQSNRLRMVTENPGKATVVALGKALSPAPSWAALGWLETSIRSYAKFVDVAAKASSADDGEVGVMRRERVAIDEVHGLLRETLGSDSCPTCGTPL